MQCVSLNIRIDATYVELDMTGHHL